MNRLNYNLMFFPVKKKYREMSVILHPDHSKDDGSKFRALKLAYDVLVNPDRRLKYDTNGVIDPHVYIVTDSQLENCRNRYRGTESELQAIRNAWLAHRGNIVRSMNDVPFMWGNFADPLDPERARFQSVIDGMIHDGQVPATFTKKRKLELEDKVAEAQISKCSKHTN